MSRAPTEGRPAAWLDRDSADTLCGLFDARVAATPDAPAYRFYSPRRGAWLDRTWAETDRRVAAWTRVLKAQGVGAGDRVAIMLRNSPEWLCVEQAAMRLGAMSVGLFCADTPASNAHLVAHSQSCVLVAVKARWVMRLLAADPCEHLRAALVFTGGLDEDARLTSADAALEAATDDTDPFETRPRADDVASLVYTSGSSGRARGAMLTHANLLSNAQDVADALPAVADEYALSYVPLAHSYERVVDAYRAMITGARIVFCRHPRFLGLTLAREPVTTLIGVPRIYERFYIELHRWLSRHPRWIKRLVATTINVGESVFERQQGRGRFALSHLAWPLLRYFVARRCLRLFGAHMQLAVSGAAALPHPVARTLVGLGLPVLQGYGLTEAGPVVSVNRVDNNEIDSVGVAINGVATKIGPDNELLVRSPGVMHGYWRDAEATARVLSPGGWLHTGDKVSRLDKKRLYLTGRMKEVIVMTSGEKASPEPIEETLRLDPLVTRAIVVGEARPVLAAVISCPAHRLTPIMRRLGLDPDTPQALAAARLENYFLERFARLMTQFPAHAQIRRVAVTTDGWRQDNSLVTATDKTRRRRVARRYATDIDRLYGRRAAGQKTDVSQNTNLG
ncbi:long-chain fatty acid--CoA ligase [Salinisphaera sp. Q1T1-3]|uniref:AMP-dependent synthetase/ligase n=1 Tax=Salinisphaera sp. Q1T1-3 TaxID=2321229 RepID=UPI001314032E|nr:AMP-binding protein [Salinisphaera sp. Q1T1-3]